MEKTLATTAVWGAVFGVAHSVTRAKMDPDGCAVAVIMLLVVIAAVFATAFIWTKG